MKVLVTGGSGFIGTNFINMAREIGWEVVNIDLSEPKYVDHLDSWMRIDIRDESKLLSVFNDFQPNYVVHLAATIGVELGSETDFSTNDVGVKSVLDIATLTNSVERIIVASSLLVCENGYIPKSDTDYRPPNAYGESKVRTEEVTRYFGTQTTPWIIVRPTSVWGPWFDGGYLTFFNLIERGLYFQPGSFEIVKPTTFVLNACHMMATLLSTKRQEVVGRTFYLSDWPSYSTYEWATIVSREYGRGKIRTFPLPLARILATAGDMISHISPIASPITNFRLNNMLTGGAYPIDNIKEIVGVLPWPLESAVKVTVQWINDNANST